MTPTRPLRVVVVGAGPAGMYAAGHLLEGPGGTYLDGRLQQLVRRRVEVDVLDRLPTPWGLVRHGVAPDHPEKKLVQRIFEETANRPGFRFFGDIEVGTHVSHQELLDWYDAVIYAHGASGDAPLGIPGEDLPGSLSARELVAWYNGHPDFAELPVDLSHERAVVVGNGNVALDVARILTQPVESLVSTDVADHAAAALAASKVREVVVLGRRASFHGAFNNHELAELGRIEGVQVVVENDDLPSDHDVVLDRTTRRKLSTLDAYSTQPRRDSERRIVLRFLSSPVEILGTDAVTGLVVGRNYLDLEGDGRAGVASGQERTVLDTGLVLRAIGYFGNPLAGVPFDSQRGVIPHRDGRVLDQSTLVPGLYVTGWAKRGAQGIIGSNKKCARDTVRSLLADADSWTLPTQGTLNPDVVERRLRERQPHLVDQDAWLRLDDHERRLGRASGRPRSKLVDRRAMLIALSGSVDR
jgi:ferredoxin--NADP+ reductase